MDQTTNCGTVGEELLKILRCPSHPDGGRLIRLVPAATGSPESLRCPECAQDYPMVDGIPDLLVRTPGNADFIEAEARQWDDQSARYEESRRCSVEYAAGVTAAVEALAPQAGELILEAASGTGMTIRRYRECGCRIVALDVSLESLLRLREALGTQVCCIRADLAHLPFAGAAFDRALCANALQHVPAADLRERCMAELARVVRPGGRVAVTAHQYSRSKRRRGWVREGAASTYSGRIQFIHRFEAPEFRQLLASHLRVERVLGAGYPLPYRLKLSPLSHGLEPLLRRGGIAVPSASMLVGVASVPPPPAGSRSPGRP